MSKSSLDEVHPGVYLGDYEQANNFQQLKAHNITHVLNCAKGLACPHKNALIYKQISLNDEIAESILPCLQETNE
jgi:hypothetical protein